MSAAVTQWFDIERDGQPTKIGWWDIKYFVGMTDRYWWDGREWKLSCDGATSMFGNVHTHGECYRGLAVQP